MRRNFLLMANVSGTLNWQVKELFACIANFTDALPNHQDQDAG
jgi:hypothetical protein